MNLPLPICCYCYLWQARTITYSDRHECSDIESAKYSDIITDTSTYADTDMVTDTLIRTDSDYVTVDNHSN